MFRRLAVAVFGLVLALGSASAASAQTSPITLNFFYSPLPVVGSQLSDSTLTPQVSLKDGWTVTSPNGIANASVEQCQGQGDPPCNTVWNYTGGGDKVSGQYQWSQSAWNAVTDIDGSATDKLGNTTGGGGGDDIQANLYGYSAASFSKGWQFSTCKCYTGGHILYSTTPGATATFVICGGQGDCQTHDWTPMAAFVSDTGPGRGKVAVSVTGLRTHVVNLGVGGVKQNRVVVWDTPFLHPVFHAWVMTVKVISGRVDVDGFLTLPDPFYP